MTDAAAALEAAQPYMAALVAELEAAGAITSRQWGAAFAAVPRHVFVPRWYEQETNGRGIAVWRMTHEAGGSSLARIYRDATLVTALDPDTAQQVDRTAWTGVATSSSTLPSLMAGMLEDLSVEDGHRVLEIGTGTGYNAALLCARLGEHLVYSVDIDPALVETAQRRLSSIGYAPRLVEADGQNRYPAGDQFDRIIATCSVPRIPGAWAEQTRPGGIIVADVSLGIEGGLVRLAVNEEGDAIGRFTGTAGRFMAARTDARTYQRRRRAQAAPEKDTRPTSVTAADIRANYPFRLLLAFRIQNAEIVYYSDGAGGAMSLQVQRDGDWARVPLTGGETGLVSYGGKDLWAEVEAAWEWWTDAGRPSQDRFGYVREADGMAFVWYLPDGSRPTRTWLTDLV
ncbi:methyltransferase domain-containing protein [Streptomyces sp. NPDC006923]|uniref:methyltransferase domain-containing protein n=1 Tax=Streptomyces sp. NPDC006923 TaxID=3155355 RepID=UPI0034101926